MFEFLDNKRNRRNEAEIRTAGVMDQFHYDFGRVEGVQQSYTLTRSKEGVEVVIQRPGSKESEKRGTVGFDVLSVLYRLLMDHKIYLWNGFHKSNSVILTGYSFSLQVKFENWTLSANGCAMKPVGYDEAHEALRQLLTEMESRMSAA